MIDLTQAQCARHRDALIDFANGHAVGSATAGALDHLGRCRACEAELAVTATTIMALRRMFREAADVEPSADAWNRLRNRVDRPVRPSRVSQAPVLGVLLAASVAVTVGFFGIGPGSTSRSTETPIASRVALAAQREVGAASDPTFIRWVAGAQIEAHKLPMRKATPDGDVALARLVALLPGEDTHSGRPMARA